MTENPPQLLEDAFRAVYKERMQGLPFVNPALAIEAVDVLPWNGHWLGVLITPGHDSDCCYPITTRLAALRRAKSASRFPCGIFEFIGGT